MWGSTKANCRSSARSTWLLFLFSNPGEEFLRFRVTHLESNNVPQALIDYWTGHAKKSDGEDVQKTMNQLYTKMEKETVFREEVSERIGIGFDLPKPAVVPSVPRNAVEVEVENAVEIVVK